MSAAAIPPLLSRSSQDFESLVRPWLSTIRRYAWVQLGNDWEGMEEVQQEVLIALATKKTRYDGNSQFSTFLFAMVHHKAVDYLRKRTRENRHRQTLSERDWEQRPELLDSRSPVDELIRHEESKRLLELIMKLPLPDRNLIFLREVEDLGEKECARILGLALGTVKSRLHRLKRKLFLIMTEGNKEEGK